MAAQPTSGWGALPLYLGPRAAYKRAEEESGSLVLLMRDLRWLGEPSEAKFDIPIKVFEIFIHVRKMPLLKDSLRQ